MLLIKEVTEEAMKIAISYGKDTIVILHKLLKNKNKFSRPYLMCLLTCLDSCNEGIYDLPHSIESVKAGDWLYVNIIATNASDMAIDCESTFTDQFNIKSLLTRSRNQFFTHLCIIPLTTSFVSGNLTMLR
ncbi:hypothetical protein Sjap_009415 [Stephania japonica]|uniref:Uncharacterized protein n=1 Tax=Stephania japonica TaxID=461633 RepID=A0AAP0PFF1_9MAGN